MPVRYRKLSGGGWGVAITGEDASGIEVGDRVTASVERRDGTTHEATVKAVWRGECFYGGGDAVLARFVKAERTPHSASGAPAGNAGLQAGTTAR